MTPSATPEFTAGLLDGGARIYPNAIALRANAHTCQSLHSVFGGSIEGDRWLVRSRGPRVDLLRKWHARSVFRRSEIEDALASLDALVDDLSLDL